MTNESLVPTIIETIEKEAARRMKNARATYQAEMKALNATHRMEQRKIETKEQEELKAAERWRVTNVAAIRGTPVALSDVQSVKRDVGEGRDKRTVSLPRVAFLERGKGVA